MLTVVITAVPAGVAALSRSTATLNARVTFEFVADEPGFPANLSDWPGTVAAQKVGVALSSLDSPLTIIAEGHWPGFNDLSEAQRLWSEMIAIPRDISASWGASDQRRADTRRDIQRYSVKHLVSGWAKVQTWKLLERKQLPPDESLSLSDRESQAFNDFYRFHGPTQSEGFIGNTQATLSVSDLAHIASQHPFLGLRVGLNCDCNFQVPRTALRKKNLVLRALVTDNSFHKELRGIDSFFLDRMHSHSHLR